MYPALFSVHVYFTINVNRVRKRVLLAVEILHAYFGTLTHRLPKRTLPVPRRQELKGRDGCFNSSRLSVKVNVIKIKNSTEAEDLTPSIWLTSISLIAAAQEIA